MQYRTLGETNLRVSVAGIGTGGPSRVGQRDGGSEAESVALLHAAFDRGVNLLDSSEGYGTEPIVGRALRSRARDEFVISTKASMRIGDRLRTGSEVAAALRASLERLGTDHIDIYHLHAVLAEDYAYARDALLPVLVEHRNRGTIRAIGITEAFTRDTEHHMLSRAVADGCWDVLMVGFNVLNQSARTCVLEPARDAGIGVLGMFAVRRVLSDVKRLRETLMGLVAEGYLDDDGIGDDPARWLIGSSGARSLTALAYRFCRHEPGIDSVLFGTGDLRHLEANIDALLEPPLPAATIQRLRQLFARVTHVSGQ